MKSACERDRALDEPVVLNTLAEMPPLPVSLGTTMANKTGNWRYIRPFYEDKTPPCNHACPAGSDIVHVLAAVKAGDAEAAWRLLVAENPLPGVCGRVCPHPCERDCNRGDLGGAIAIRAVERYLADEASARSWHIEPAETLHEGKVAVIGSGPAGLSCAYHLARLGYPPTIFEATNAPGGLLRHGIPAYRLPRAVLDREIAAIEATGVRLALNRRLGDNLSLADLADMDAIFLAVGQCLSQPLAIEGEGAEGVLSGLELLRRLAGGERVELGRRVLVVGGGNTAMDAARSAIRLGAEVIVVYRRSEEEMPAVAEEVQEAREEGVCFEFLAAPTAIPSEGGRVVAMRCIRTQLGEPDSSGRRRPVPIPGSELELAADTVIIAAGQQLDANSLAGSALSIERGRIAADAACATGTRKVFAGGDAATGEGTVAQAIGSGKRAALAIHHFLQHGRLPDFAGLQEAPHVRAVAASPTIVGPDDINRDYVEAEPRLSLAQRAPEVRRLDFDEVNTGLDDKAAQGEAERCISCGTCNACDTCLIFCPDVAIARGEPGAYTIDYDYCKGCGICATECPRNALAMREEGL